MAVKRFRRPRLPKRLPAIVVTEETHKEVTDFATNHNISIAEVMREAIDVFFLPENVKKYDHQGEKFDFKSNRKQKSQKARAS